MSDPNFDGVAQSIPDLESALIALAAKLDESANRLDVTVEQSTRRLILSINSAADAVRAAAATSERHARGLARAIWALAASTVALMLVAMLHVVYG